MTLNHHPDAATLMSYAAGGLTTALAAAVAGHLSFCPKCRQEMRILEMIGGTVLRDLPINAASSGPLRIPELEAQPAFLAGAPSAVPAAPANAEVPHALIGLIGTDLDSRDWSWQAPGLYQHMIPVPGTDGGLLRLVKAEPGRSIPEHTHEGMELTLVLRGAYRDTYGEFRRGDVADLDDTATHLPIADKDLGCICLVASEAQPVFRGLIPRVVQPFLR